jgi:Rrf2 family protein
MKLSTKGRYGLKAMFDLALFGGDTPVSLTAISERQHVTVNYLEQLIAPLRKAGLVKSVRGAQGGYLLAKPPSEITVADILFTLEGSLAPSECVNDNNEESCSNADYCVTRMIYEKMRDSINDVVKSITLQDMIDDHNNMKNNPENNTNMFCL